MKLLPTSLLAAAMVASAASIMVAGCNEKSGDVAQKDNSAATADQQAANNQQAPNKVAGAANAIDDTTITTKVKAAIVAEPTLSALDIKVSTAEGVVTLSGTIDDPQKLAKAEQVAMAVDGVRTVNNELVVKTS